jgi:hypothetical protein
VKKNGQQIARENVAILSAWLEGHKSDLPTLPDGSLNKSAIARGAGLDKQIFVSNPAAKALLQQYGSLATAARQDRPTSVGAALLRKKDVEIARLQALVAKRELELSNLRKEIREARQLRAMHETMIETMRHVKPLPDKRP